MKRILIVSLMLCSVICKGQKHYSKHVVARKVNYCKLPLEDSLFISSPDMCCVTHFINGKSCVDSTGMAEYNRRKLIGDTTYFSPQFDTSRVILLTQVDDIKLKTEAFKVTDMGKYFTSNLYEDTFTRKHIMGNGGMSFEYSIDKVWPSVYLQLDRKPFPSNVHIYGEVKNN